MDRGRLHADRKGTTGYRLDSMIRVKPCRSVKRSMGCKAAAAGMVRFADHREVLPDYPGGVYAINRQWAAENRGVLVKFLRTWNDALGWCRG